MTYLQQDIGQGKQVLTEVVYVYPSNLSLRTLIKPSSVAAELDICRSLALEGQLVNTLPNNGYRCCSWVAAYS